MTHTAINSFPEGYPEALEIIGNIAFEEMLEKGIDANAAKVAALEIAERIRKEVGGSYLPRGYGLDSKKLKQTVCEQFNGTNHAALARKHHISVGRVRQILKEDRRTKRNSISPASST